MTCAAQQPDARLGRHRRLKKSREFAQTFAQQRRFVGRCMVLWHYAGADAEQRLGVVASRKIGGAVLRNRAKRRLREVFRLNRHNFRGGYDVVLVARPPVVKAAWGELVEELNSLAEQAGLSAVGGKLES